LECQLSSLSHERGKQKLILPGSSLANFKIGVVLTSLKIRELIFIKFFPRLSFLLLYNLKSTLIAGDGAENLFNL
jgi:hypothetical protein